MGLINWFKDKIFLALERKVILLEAEIEGLKGNMSSLRNQVNRKLGAEAANASTSSSAPVSIDAKISKLPPELKALWDTLPESEKQTIINQANL